MCMNTNGSQLEFVSVCLCTTPSSNGTWYCLIWSWNICRYCIQIHVAGVYICMTYAGTSFKNSCFLAEPLSVRRCDVDLHAEVKHKRKTNSMYFRWKDFMQQSKNNNKWNKSTTSTKWKWESTKSVPCGENMHVYISEWYCEQRERERERGWSR